MQNVFSKLSSYFTPQVKNRLAQATGWTSYPSEQKPNQTVASSSLLRNAMGLGAAAAKGYSVANQIMAPKVTPVKPPTDAASAYKPPAINPPSINPPSMNAPSPQPTAYDTYNQKYNASLLQSKARKEQEAAANKAENEQQAQEQYDVNKGTYNTAQTNIQNLMSGFRDRIAAGDARLAQQAGQNRERATTASGENQRQLAIDRRQAMNDTEKRYAALGTLDSYGTGSFQSAVENKDSDFLRLTAKNKQDNEYALQEIDNKLFDAKASSQERLATEEGKYNDAVAQIQTQLAGNEVDKARALRAASMLYQQRTGAINDEFDSLTLAAEKEKADMQQKLQAASMDEQKLRSLFTSASPDFLRTGQPTTANDQYLIFKYPKEAQAYQEMLGGGKKSGDSVKMASDLRSELYNRSKENNYTVVSQYIKKIETAPDTAAGDMSMIFSYMKLLDPNSTVREGEYANAQNATGIPGQVQNAYNNALAGRRLNPIQRTEFVQSAKSAAQPAVDQQKQLVEFYNKQASSAGINPNDVSGMYEFPKSASTTVTVVSPQGVEGTMDKSELQEAINNGYRLK